MRIIELEARDLQLIETAQIGWFATVQGKLPHLAPIWFVLFDDILYFCTQNHSRKVRNLKTNVNSIFAINKNATALVAHGLSDLSDPRDPDNEEIRALFKSKYDWDITEDSKYTVMIGLKPNYWIRT